MRRVIVIGAGAAGMMAAIVAASRGAETLLLEGTKDGGRKILISGGGRCNILPAHLDESRFVTESPPHVLRRILRSWPLREQVDFFERQAGIPLVEEAATGKLFPASQRARDVRDRLLALARARGVRVLTSCRVTAFSPRDGGWCVERESETPLHAAALIVATGGLSVPATGSDGAGLRMVEQLGHTVHPPYAALTPLTASPAPFGHLAGVSLGVTIDARAPGLRATATGGFLFTHEGYSGPAVLDVSHVAVRSRQQGSPAILTVRWNSGTDEGWTAALRPRGTRTVLAALSEQLPARLAEALMASADVPRERTLATLTRAERGRLIDVLVRSVLPWTGDAGYRKAEVTGGGVSLAEVNSRTMESRRHPGLYLCGEMLDSFGPIGGYNFYWAWATGRAAGGGSVAGSLR